MKETLDFASKHLGSSPRQPDYGFRFPGAIICSSLRIPFRDHAL